MTGDWLLIRADDAMIYMVSRPETYLR